MKKKLLIIGGIVAVLLIAVLVICAMFLGSLVKKGVETVGPHITKTDMKLDSASISVLSGSGTLSGFLLGNPEGYKTESAIKVGRVSLGVKPGSLLSDKIHITHVHVEAPEITFEGGLKNNNLNKILENVQATTGGASTNQADASTGSSKKIQIDDFVLKNAKVKINSPLTVGQTLTVALPDIHITDIGKGSEGATPADVTERILKEVVNGTLAVVTKAVANIGKGATDAVKGATSNSLDKVSKGLKGLLGK